jgi:hypothetical protein
MSHHIPGATPARDRLQKVASEGRNHHPRGHQTQSPARTRPQPPPGSGARGRGRRPAARHGDRRARGRRGARGPTRNRPSTDSLPPDNPPATEPLPAPRRGQVKARLRPGEGRLSPGEGRLRGHLRRPPRPATATPSGWSTTPGPPRAPSAPPKRLRRPAGASTPTRPAHGPRRPIPMADLAISFQGTPIRRTDERVNLTDMWRAAGSDKAKSPYEWLRQDGTVQFLEYLGETLNTGQGRVEKNAAPNGVSYDLVHVDRGGAALFGDRGDVRDGGGRGPGGARRGDRRWPGRGPPGGCRRWIARGPLGGRPAGSGGRRPARGGGPGRTPAGSGPAATHGAAPGVGGTGERG